VSSHALAHRLDPVLRRIERFVRDGEIDGAGLAVALGNELVGDFYVGAAAPGRPAGPDTLWPLASASKLYTAAAVMALVERGELTLGTPVREVLPAFDSEQREGVTVRHLLTHTSGLIYESPEMEAVLLRKAPLDEILDEAYRHPLQFAPGSRYSYSDFGIGLAGRVAASVAGLPFPEVVRRYILEPGELRDTFLPPAPADYPRLARVAGSLADGTDSAMYNSPYAIALGHPAFGAVATARDLLRFGRLFAPGAEPRVLSAATVRAMTTDQTGGFVTDFTAGDGPAAPRSQGLGFMIRGAGGWGFGDLTSPASYGHGGASGCMLLVDPVHDVTLAYVSNRHVRADPRRFGPRLESVVNGVLAAVTR
jgi:CubicO group peptidase (beta-lactamase class C family)